MIKIFEGISAGGISNFRGKLISSVIFLHFVSHGASATTTYDDPHIFLWSSVKFSIFETFMGPKRYCRKTTLRDFNATKCICTFKDIIPVSIVRSNNVWYQKPQYSYIHCSIDYRLFLLFYAHAHYVFLESQSKKVVNQEKMPKLLSIKPLFKCTQPFIWDMLSKF